MSFRCDFFCHSWRKLIHFCHSPKHHPRPPLLFSQLRICGDTEHVHRVSPSKFNAFVLLPGEWWSDIRAGWYQSVGRDERHCRPLCLPYVPHSLTACIWSESVKGNTLLPIASVGTLQILSSVNKATTETFLINIDRFHCKMRLLRRRLEVALC